ncbi:hypothetical protein ACJIZ3_002533 [Penstemon smallii]|uniref:DUF674 family protein n=1 Tax=Penstemon smallii TaxID=265156 RepID=A0ABD3U818_9LAMI
MSADNGVEFSMKVLLNKEKNKVLFAEVDGYLADILISFLTLPLGTIMRLLTKQFAGRAPVIGSLNTLYKGLGNLDTNYFWTEAGKLMLLNPNNPFEGDLQKLKINIDDTPPTKYFICQNWNCTWDNLGNVSVNMYHGTGKCVCGHSMNREIRFLSTDSNQVGAAGAFTSEAASFIITDDLRIVPNLIGTGSLVSESPLTDLIFNKTQMVPATVNSGLGIVIGKNSTTPTYKRMTLKIILQKSTGKFLLAQTIEDVIDFLFSLFTIPLGGVISLLGGDFFIGSIHNLHRSLASLNGCRYLKNQDPYNTTPQLPCKYLSNHQLFPLNQKMATSLHCFSKKTIYENRIHLCHNWPPYLQKDEKVHNVQFLDPKGQGSYIKGPAMFTVTDDLIVTPTSAISSFSILNRLKIPLSDIEEYVIDIGEEEALSILKASLASTSAISIGLMPFLKKHPKQDK